MLSYEDIEDKKDSKEDTQGYRVRRIPWELCQPYWITDNLVIQFHDELLEKLSDEDIYVLGDILEEID